MRYLLTLALVLALCVPAMADDKKLTTHGINELADLGAAPADSDFLMLWDVSAQDVVKAGMDDFNLDVMVDVTATAAELNAAADVSARYVDIGDNTTYTVLVANSGKPHSIPDLTSGLTVTLPTAAAGLEYDFYYAGSAADAQDWIFDTGADANFFLGGFMFADSDAGDAADEISVIDGNGSSNSKLTINNPEPGIMIKMICNGTQWLLAGFVNSDTVPAFADQ